MRLKLCMHAAAQVEVLSGLQHDRIVRLLGACLAPPTICIVEELALGGSLYDLLHTKSGARCCKPMPHSQVSHAPLGQNVRLCHAPQSQSSSSDFDRADCMLFD